MRTEAVGGLQSVQDGLDNGQYRQAGSNFSSAASVFLDLSRNKSSPLNRDPASTERTAGRYYGLLGRAHVMNTSYQDAVSAYKKAMDLDPANGQHYSGLALAYVGLKQYDDALAAAKRGVELAANSQTSYASLGDVHAARKEYDQAIDAYHQAVAVGPQQLAAEQENLKSAMGRALPQKIDRQMRESVNVASSDVYLKSSQMSVAQRDYAGAVDAVNKAAALTPNNPEVYSRLGALKAREGRFDDAIASLGKAIDMATSVGIGIQTPSVPKTAAPYYGSRGLYNREKGNREGAVKDAEMAYSLDPENVDAREALAAVDLDGGKYDEALKLLSLLKERPFARLLEATAYARQSDGNRAVAVYLAIPQDQILATPLMQHAEKTLKQTLRGYVQPGLDKAAAAETTGHFMEALTGYSDVVKVADEATVASTMQRVAQLLKGHPYLAELPEEARKYALRGDVFIKDGRFEDALREYRTALGLAPFNPKLHFNAALVCGQLKNYRQAIDDMTIYLQLSPDAPDARAAKDQIYQWGASSEKEEKR